jgi:signal transduction histidine kinase
LLDNALAHTTSRIWVEVATDPGERRVTATVRDDGAGLDPTQTRRLFERFARGDHGDGRRFGLGLALVREVVAAHGGSVTATGSPGEGATFTITLPAWRPPAEDATG